MAYRFRRQESISKGVRRIVRERLNQAIGHLELEGEQMHEGIHEARKRFKEIRAVLRLVRADLDECYSIENRWYRDAGRALAGARDLQASVETWKKLRSRFTDLCESDADNTIEQHLKMRLERENSESGDIRRARETILEGLPGAYERISRWPIMATGFKALRGGAGDSYRQGRRNLQKIHVHADPVTFHAWRKRVKDLWYHTRLIRPVWQEEMSIREAWLKDLSDTLGDDHDLVVFAQLIQQYPDMFGTRDFCGELRQCIDLQQQEFRQRAVWLGRMVYAEKTKAYIRRIQVYWGLWRPDGLP